MNSNERKETSKEVFERIEQCCVSACLGLGQSPYNRFLQSITPCKKDLEIIKQDLEILEIFKDNVMIDEDEKVVTLFSKNKEVVNKIKEWLYE